MYMKRHFFLLLYTIVVLTLSACNSSYENTRKGVFKKVKQLVDKNRCDEALTHFSRRVKEEINKRLEDEGNLQDWCNAWKITDEQLQQGLKEIESGNYDSFVQEDGVWKIDDL